MIRALSAALLLASCAAAPVKAPPVIPQEALSCPMGASVPLPPPKPRTVDAISTWGNRNERALRFTLAVLRECDRRRDEVVRLLEKH